MSHSVGELARIAGISVRTLHHYDEIGLLSPAGRTAAGYRQYDASDVERLQQILTYRALGFDLAAIAELLSDPGLDPLDHLRRQHARIQDEVDRLGRLARRIEHWIEAREMGINLTPEEMLEVFGDFDPTEHAAEAEERWGGTDAYAESKRRTSRYSKEDWARMGAEVDRVEAGLAAAMEAGLPATGEKAMALAEEHRRHISRWFYDCSYQMHRGLAEMYTADPRFADHYDRRAPGLAAYVRDAILANAERAGG